MASAAGQGEGMLSPGSLRKESAALLTRLKFLTSRAVEDVCVGCGG